MSGLDQQYKEWFSRSFLQATAASAGVSIQFVQDDYFGVDAVLGNGYTSVDVQLKATANPEYDNAGDLVFDLDVLTFNKLRETQRQNSAYLVVAVIDPDRDRWVQLESSGTVLRDRAYWLRLTGQSPTPNRSTIRLKIPKQQTLTTNSVSAIIQAERKALVS